MNSGEKYSPERCEVLRITVLGLTGTRERNVDVEPFPLAGSFAGGVPRPGEKCAVVVAVNVYHQYIGVVVECLLQSVTVLQILEKWLIIDCFQRGLRITAVMYDQVGERHVKCPTIIKKITYPIYYEDSVRKFLSGEVLGSDSHIVEVTPNFSLTSLCHVPRWTHQCERVLELAHCNLGCQLQH